MTGYTLFTAVISFVIRTYVYNHILVITPVIADDMF